jgi:E3 ubiquitin-protein ligase HUWE1
VRESDVHETVARAKAARANDREEGSGSAALATTSITSVQDRKGKRPREKARKEKGVETKAEGAETEVNVPDALEEGDPGAFSSAAAPLVLLRLLGSPAFESHAALVELALASLLSVLTASKKERERLAHDWRQNKDASRDADGDAKAKADAKPRGERRSDALEPWRLGFAAAPARDDRDGETKAGGEPALRKSQGEARSERSGGGAPLGGLRPLSSAAIRRAVQTAPPSTTRALARLVARDALTSGAQTKAFDLVRALSATAPEARAPLAAAFAAEAEARAADAVAALAEAAAAARRGNARDATATATATATDVAENARAETRAALPAPAIETAPVSSTALHPQLSVRASALASAPAAVLRLTRAAAAALVRDEALEEEFADVARAEAFEAARVDALAADPKLSEAEANARADAFVEALANDLPSTKPSSEKSESEPEPSSPSSMTKPSSKTPTSVSAPAALDPRALRDALRAFAATLEPVWSALGDAAGAMEASPGIATAGGADASARARHLGAHNTLVGGVDIKSILPAVEARFALASALARAESDAEREETEGGDAAKAASGGVSSPSRDSKRARVGPGSGSGSGGGTHATSSVAAVPESPAVPVDDERFAFGLARVTSPAFGLAGAPNGAGASGGAGAARRLSAASPQTAPTRSTLTARRSDSAVADVWNFANKHRAVVNALVRSQPSLLDETDGSLRVLLEKPRLIDFDNKVAHIRARLKRLAEDPRARAHGATRVTINRKQVLTDSFARLQYLRPSEVRGRVMIEFAGEEGIDAGGLTREWYVLMAREMFNPDAALFELSPSGDGSYQPYKNSGVNELHLSYFRFIGRVIGKAVFDGYLVDAHFTRPFYKHLLGIPLNYDDMEAFDPEFHKSLSFMLEHPLAASGLDHLTFSETKNYFGVETDVELIPDGANVAVTDENKLEYVNLVAAHRMTDSIRDQIAAFSRGFNEIRPARRRAHFKPERARAFDQRHALHRCRGLEKQHGVPGVQRERAAGAVVLGGGGGSDRGGSRAFINVCHGNLEGAFRRVQGAAGHLGAAEVPDPPRVRRRERAAVLGAHVLQPAGPAGVRDEGRAARPADVRHQRGERGVWVRVNRMIG